MGTMKEVYKELRKKLSDEFVKPKGYEYAVVGGVGEWFKQSGIKPTPKHLNIVCTIFGSVPYPYRPQDRKVILEYLKKHKYKEYKNEFNTESE